MPRSVLLVDPDVDALGAIADALRARGLDVVIAADVAGAVERSRRAALDAIVAASSVCGQGGLLDRLAREGSLGRLPCIVVESGDSGLVPDVRVHARVAAGDLDALAATIASLPPRSLPVEAPQGEVRGNLSQMSLLDLLQLLAMNRRSGVVGVTTLQGTGEIYLSDGDVVDAVYRRLDGEKAVTRLLGEREGSFLYVPGAAARALRRVTGSTPALLMEAMRRVDEARAVRSDLCPGGEALFALAPPSDDAPRIERDVLRALQDPRGVDDLLDDVTAPDLEILRAARELCGRGVVRRIPRAALVVPVAPIEAMPTLRALAARLARTGYAGPPRLGIAATPPLLAAMAHAILRIEDAVPPAEGRPPIPVPHALATLRLGDGVDLCVVALPVAPENAPLWALALPGTAAVVRVGATEAAALDEACAAFETPVVDAAALVGDLDVADPQQVAALLRAAVEAVASP